MSLLQSTLDWYFMTFCCNSEVLGQGAPSLGASLHPEYKWAPGNFRSTAGVTLRWSCIPEGNKDPSRRNGRLGLNSARLTMDKIKNRQFPLTTLIKTLLPRIISPQLRQMMTLQSLTNPFTSLNQLSSLLCTHLVEGLRWL